MRLKVAGKSDVQKVAGSIISSLEESGECEVVTIGAMSLNQAVKAIIIARGIAAQKNWHIETIQYFESITTEHGEASAIVHRVKSHL